MKNNLVLAKTLIGVAAFWLATSFVIEEGTMAKQALLIGAFISAVLGLISLKRNK